MEIAFWQDDPKRAGWLTALFLGEMLTATAMGFFEDEIAQGGRARAVRAAHHLERRQLRIAGVDARHPRAGARRGRAARLVARHAARDRAPAWRSARSSARSASCASPSGHRRSGRGTDQRSTASTGCWWRSPSRSRWSASCCGARCRIAAAAGPAAARLRSGEVVGAVRRDAGRRHGSGDLFLRGDDRPPRHTVVVGRARPGCRACRAPLLHRRRIPVFDRAALVPVGIGQRDGARGVEGAICSGVSCQPTAPEILTNCCSLRAPMMIVDTVGRCSSQFSAICGTVLPVSRAIASSASTTRYNNSSRRAAPAYIGARGRRLTSGGGWLRRNLPVSRPQPSGLHTTAPTPSVETERHQLPLVVAADQRVVGLMRDIARPAVSIRHGQRLHQMPAGKVGAADVADLARPHQIVERAQRLFDRRDGVEAVQLIEVDVVGAEPAQAGLARRDQVVPRGADVVRPGPMRNVALVEIST